jgi:hypothetical protein
MTRRAKGIGILEDQIALAGGYLDHKDAVAHLGNYCRCPWSMQAGCRFSDARGNPDMSTLSRCSKPNTETCEYRTNAHVTFL